MTEQTALPKIRKKPSVEAKRKVQESKRQIAQPIVEAIRQCHAAGMGRKDMVQKFGISGSRISDITNFRTYTY